MYCTLMSKIEHRKINRIRALPSKSYSVVEELSCAQTPNIISWRFSFTSSTSLFLPPKVKPNQPHK